MSFNVTYRESGGAAPYHGNYRPLPPQPAAPAANVSVPVQIALSTANDFEPVVWLTAANDAAYGAYVIGNDSTYMGGSPTILPLLPKATLPTQRPFTTTTPSLSP